MDNAAYFEYDITVCGEASYSNGDSSVGDSGGWECLGEDNYSISVEGGNGKTYRQFVDKFGSKFAEFITEYTHEYADEKSYRHKTCAAFNVVLTSDKPSDGYQANVEFILDCDKKYGDIRFDMKTMEAMIGAENVEEAVREAIA